MKEMGMYSRRGLTHLSTLVQIHDITRYLSMNLTDAQLRLETVHSEESLCSTMVESLQTIE